MKKSIIADSSGLVSLFSTTDSTHKPAILIAKKIKNLNKALIISSEIMAETVNILGKKVGHNLAFVFAQEVFQSSEYSILNSNEIIRQVALEKFKNQPDSVSYTDCIVMAFADEFEAKEIFGFDDVFRKNGYIRFGIDKPKIKSKTALPK